jgi:hypothetical protein
MPIPLPPNALVQLDIDGTDRDVLGMLKSFIKGVERANSSKEARQQVATSRATDHSSALLKLLTDKQLSSILSDIHRLHLVTYTLGSDSRTSASAIAKTDIIKFYETPFRAEGGRLLLRGDIKSAKVLMLGFDNPRSFAAIIQLPTTVAVIRADGFPNLEAVGSLIQLTAEATPETASNEPTVATPELPATSSTMPLVPPAAIRSARPLPPATPTNQSSSLRSEPLPLMPAPPNNRQ